MGLRLNNDGTPMMSDQEIGLIRAFIDRLPDDAHCLEWGSGNSTAFFTKHRKIASWLSVEHNGNYIKHLAPHVGLNVKFVWAPEDQWYIDCVKLNAKCFDFILVDGLDQHREGCVRAGFDLLTPNGIMLLHDSGRKEYWDWIVKMPNFEKLLNGEVEQPNGYFAHRGLTLFRKTI